MISPDTPTPTTDNTQTGVPAARFLADIPVQTASRAYGGVSFDAEGRGRSTRSDYAAQLAEDYADLRASAEKGGTLEQLEETFGRYRAGYCSRWLKFLHSSSRCVSWFIAGPSNFPAARYAKRNEISNKRLNEIFEYRATALARARRQLRPDLRPIYAGDANALERLEADITKAEAEHERYILINKTIRAHQKEGADAQIAALLAIGAVDADARKWLNGNCFGCIGIPPYRLTNSSANIRRMKARHEHITRLKNTAPASAEGTNARIEECPAENRVRLFFPGKPDEATRGQLKSSGFRWTPTLGCWQAYYTYSNCAAARRFAGV